MAKNKQSLSKDAIQEVRDGIIASVADSASSKHTDIEIDLLALVLALSHPSVTDRGRQLLMPADFGPEEWAGYRQQARVVLTVLAA